MLQWEYKRVQGELHYVHPRKSENLGPSLRGLSEDFYEAIFHDGLWHKVEVGCNMLGQEGWQAAFTLPSRFTNRTSEPSRFTLMFQRPIENA